MQSLLHQGSSAPRSLKKFFIYSMSTLKTNRTALEFVVGSWVEFVVGSLLCSERFFCGYSGLFPSPRKPTLSNSNSIWNARTRTLMCFVGKQAINNFFFFFQKCQVPSPCIAWYLECRFHSFMPLSKTYLSTRYDKSESTGFSDYQRILIGKEYRSPA